MWNCLPLAVNDRCEEQRKPESSWRAESSAMAAATMRSASRNMEIDTGALVISEPSTTKREILAAGSDSPLGRSVRLPSTTRGVSLWFSYLVEYLGSTLLTYLAGVVDKMDKREYY